MAMGGSLELLRNSPWDSERMGLGAPALGCSAATVKLCWSKCEPLSSTGPSLAKNESTKRKRTDPQKLEVKKTKTNPTERTPRS